MNQPNLNPLQPQQFAHLLKVIKQRFISPYKIMYMINQQQADLFKARNQSSGCCSSSSITIPKHQMTKTETILAEEIHNIFKIHNLNQILEGLWAKFENIVKAGKEGKLIVDDNVEKFLVEKVLSEGVNLHIYNKVSERLKAESAKFSESGMLWATPNTWYAKYPSVQLDFLSSKTLNNINNPQIAFSIEQNYLKEYSQNLFKQLVMLQRDGRFEELIWSQQLSSVRNDTKLMNYPQNFAFDGEQKSFKKGQFIYPWLKRSLINLRSIPFELNQKMNGYFTISENNQISYFATEMLMLIQGDHRKEMEARGKYETFCAIGGDCTIKLAYAETNGKFLESQVVLKESSLLIADMSKLTLEIRSEKKGIFLFRSWICALPKSQ